MQGRGTITLTELGVGWTLDPKSVNDSGPAATTGGNCNGPNLNARMAGNVGQSAYAYVRDQPAKTQFTIWTYVFPTVDAAKAAFARTVASYSACNTWVDPTEIVNIFSVLPDLRAPCPSADPSKNAATKSKKAKVSTTTTTVPACPVGDESVARRRERAVPAGSSYCNAGQVLSFQDIVEVRIGAQVFRYGSSTAANDGASCDGDYPNAAPPDTAQLFLLAQQAINKYQAELKQYTKEYYATLATSTTTGKGTTSTTNAK